MKSNNGAPALSVATVISSASKKDLIEDVEDKDDKPPHQTMSKKRVAFIDAAALREDEDGRTKRARIDMLTAQSTPVLEEITPASPSTIGPSTPTLAKAEPMVDTSARRTCSSCLDVHPKHDILELSCKGDDEFETHAYCRGCLEGLFESSVTDPSHFPPRCCSKIISLFSCTPFLSATLVARFVSRREELETPNRTYCSDATCSKWVHPDEIHGNVATCSSCTRKTCALCKGKAHTGSLCPEDKDVKELMNVAQQKRW
ncbi:hypothetical protein NX059_004182 [Plenodomus lindquistii]|nr:hypothetical protein NX059_004182 [Plenodomus lindquistii]